MLICNTLFRYCFTVRIQYRRKGHFRTISLCFLLYWFCTNWRVGYCSDTILYFAEGNQKPTLFDRHYRDYIWCVREYFPTRHMASRNRIRAVIRCSWSNTDGDGWCTQASGEFWGHNDPELPGRSALATKGPHSLVRTTRIGRRTLDNDSHAQSSLHTIPTLLISRPTRGVLAIEALLRKPLPLLQQRLKENIISDLPSKIVQECLSMSVLREDFLFQ